MSLWRRAKKDVEARMSVEQQGNNATEAAQVQLRRHYEEFLAPVEVYIDQFRTVMKKAKNPGMIYLRGFQDKKYLGWRSFEKELLTYYRVKLSVFKLGDWELSYDKDIDEDIASSVSLSRSHGKLWYPQIGKKT